jgi:hypothetical protein
MWLTPPSVGQPFRSRQICAASLGSTEHSGATSGGVIGRLELAIACRLATCVDLLEDGSSAWTRTRNPPVNSRMLYH